MSQRIREAFIQELDRADESDVNLARAALLMAGYLTQTSEIKPYLKLLDEMAQAVEPDVAAADSNRETVDVLNHYMFGEMNFYGNAQNYYLPSNSFLNKVLELRTGIPISLSLVYLEVGWRLNLPLWGIGMPGHFIVGYGPIQEPIYIDVFNQGRILSEDDCFRICNIPQSGRIAFKNEYLRPVGKKAILFRMLLNLKHIYLDWEEWDKTYKTVDLMALVRPDEITEIRDRGLLAYRLDKLRDAIFDINRYLFLAPNSIDAGWLKRRVELMEEKLLRLN